jgi:hypothetical protein
MLDDDSCRPLLGNRHRCVTSGKEGAESERERESRERARAGGRWGGGRERDYRSLCESVFFVGACLC